jgi:hypothetical protein
MIRNLDPTQFVGQLSFRWLASHEGIDELDALARLVAKLDLPTPAGVQVMSQVLSDLARIGQTKFRRHYEFRKVASAKKLVILELKFLFAWSEQSQLRLRLYSTCDPEKVDLIGLCFREKKVGATPDQTRRLQNRDIESANQLAKGYFELRSFEGGPA